MQPSFFSTLFAWLSDLAQSELRITIGVCALSLLAVWWPLTRGALLCWRARTVTRPGRDDEGEGGEPNDTFPSRGPPVVTTPWTVTLYVVLGGSISNGRTKMYRPSPDTEASTSMAGSTLTNRCTSGAGTSRAGTLRPSLRTTTRPVMYPAGLIATGWSGGTSPPPTSTPYAYMPSLGRSVVTHRASDCPGRRQ